MTGQKAPELREEIAEVIVDFQGELMNILAGNVPGNPRSTNDYADSILALVDSHFAEEAKKRGWKSPEECEACADGFISTADSNELRSKWAKANGYVKLAEDQDLPEPPDRDRDSQNDYSYGWYAGFAHGEDCMIQAHFRRVKE